jgi:hypothetical protein
MSGTASSRMLVRVAAVLPSLIFVVAGCGGSTKTVTQTVGSSPAPSTQPTAIAHTPRNTSAASGDYVGTTSQGLPISFTVTPTSVESIQFSWRAICADGKSHLNTIVLGSTSIKSGAFSASGTLDTGASSSVSGKVTGDTASGRLSRSGPSAFGTNCSDTGVTWHAYVSG